MNAPPRHVLGVDPGLRACGWGVVERGAADRGPRLVAYGTVRPDPDGDNHRF